MQNPPSKRAKRAATPFQIFLVLVVSIAVGQAVAHPISSQLTKMASTVNK